MYCRSPVFPYPKLYNNIYHSWILIGCKGIWMWQSFSVLHPRIWKACLSLWFFYYPSIHILMRSPGSHPMWILYNTLHISGIPQRIQALLCYLRLRFWITPIIFYIKLNNALAIISYVFGAFFRVVAVLFNDTLDFLYVWFGQIFFRFFGCRFNHFILSCISFHFSIQSHYLKVLSFSRGHPFNFIKIEVLALNKCFDLFVLQWFRHREYVCSAWSIIQYSQFHCYAPIWFIEVVNLLLPFFPSLHYFNHLHIQGICLFQDKLRKAFRHSLRSLGLTFLILKFCFILSIFALISRLICLCTLLTCRVPRL